MANLEDRPHGYDSSLFVSVDQDFICAICMEVCRDAVETTVCGHVFCEKCISWSLEHRPECPLDHRPLQASDLHASKFIRRRVLSMQVNCPQRESHQCAFNGSLQDLFERHNQTPCPDCNAPCAPCLLNEHKASQCSSSVIACPNCECDIKRGELSAHEEKECPNACVACTYANYGCQERPRRNELQQHINNNAVAHIQLTETYHQRMINALQERNQELAERLANFETKSDNFQHGARIGDCNLNTNLRMQSDNWMCDVCTTNQRIRHKCLVCFDFDLCDKCFKGNRVAKNHQTSHFVLTYVSPLFGPWELIIQRR